MADDAPQPPNNSDREQRVVVWNRALRHIRGSMDSYQKAIKDNDTDTKARMEEEIPRAYRSAAESAPDDAKREEMKNTAAQFERANDEEKEAMIHPLLKGLAVLFLVPFALVGGVLYGVGSVLMGVGDLLAGGPLVRRGWFGKT